MSPKQKAKLITELVLLRKMALDNVLYHENEAGRYRKIDRELSATIDRVYAEENKTLHRRKK